MSEGLTQLGSRTALPSSPEEAVLECIPYEGPNLVVRLQIPEFTSLCPVTGAPDFGRIVIDYVPRSLLVESKSVKLFAGSFRNYGCFHEKIVGIFLSRIWKVADPHVLRVAAFFCARGGIPLDVFAQCGELLPPGVPALPPLDLNPYTNR